MARYFLMYRAYRASNPADRCGRIRTATDRSCIEGSNPSRAFRSLIEPGNTEVLLNFMFQFANRFASSQDRMPPLEGWLGGLSDEEGSWRKDFAVLKGAEREAAITDRARQALRMMGNYVYAPALTVDETATERPRYKLIYLSRHPIGLRVFRDAHVKALETQATYKSARRRETRRQQYGMDDLFASPTAMNPGERSALEISDGVVAGREKVLELLRQRPEGWLWKNLWPAVLDACVITHNQLGDCIRGFREEATVDVPDWSSAAIKRPKDDEIDFEHRRWMVGGAASLGRCHSGELQRLQIQGIDESLDGANRVVRRHIIVQRCWQQIVLPAIFPLHETAHPKPPEISGKLYHKHRFLHSLGTKPSFACECQTAAVVRSGRSALA